MVSGFTSAAPCKSLSSNEKGAATRRPSFGLGGLLGMKNVSCSHSFFLGLLALGYDLLFKLFRHFLVVVELLGMHGTSAGQ